MSEKTENELVMSSYISGGANMCSSLITAVQEIANSGIQSLELHQIIEFIEKTRDIVETVSTTTGTVGGIPQPYLTTTKQVTEYHWNPDYPDKSLCKCGHTYYRHFDTYDSMTATGCKYCSCMEFIPVENVGKKLDD